MGLEGLEVVLGYDFLVGNNKVEKSLGKIMEWLV